MELHWYGSHQRSGFLKNSRDAEMNSWGSNQGRHGDEMTREDLGVVLALWAASWVMVVGVVSFFFVVLA